VVLHLRDDDAVARADVRAAPRVRDEVDRLGGVAREDRLGGAPVHEARDALARALEQLRRLDRERVDAAVDGAAVRLVVVVHRVDDGARGLRGRRAVEVDEALALEDRELGGERGVGERAHQAAAATSSRTQP
jgi:DNA transposition AAA+ family ATPase